MRKWTDEQLISAVKESETLIEVPFKLGLRVAGGNIRTVKKYITKLGLDTSHFVTNDPDKLKEHLKIARSKIKKISNDILFSENSTFDRKNIKSRIIKQNLIPYSCSQCDISTWQGQNLSLHLDHVNGINTDNRLENLRFLCPNCHSLTNTYCGRNIKKPDDMKKKNNNKCLDCKLSIYDYAIRCRSCSSKARHNYKIIWPQTSSLIEMIKSSNFCSVSRTLGVSDNAIRKHLKSLGYDPKNL